MLGKQETPLQLDCELVEIEPQVKFPLVPISILISDTTYLSSTDTPLTLFLKNIEDISSHVQTPDPTIAQSPTPRVSSLRRILRITVWVKTVELTLPSPSDPSARLVRAFPQVTITIFPKLIVTSMADQIEEVNRKEFAVATAITMDFKRTMDKSIEIKSMLNGMQNNLKQDAANQNAHEDYRTKAIAQKKLRRLIDNVDYSNKFDLDLLSLLRSLQLADARTSPRSCNKSRIYSIFAS
jgi:hypothetical protein